MEEEAKEVGSVLVEAVEEAVANGTAKEEAWSGVLSSDPNLASFSPSLDMGDRSFHGIGK